MTALSSPSIDSAFLIGICTSIGGGGICAITCGSSYGFNLEIWEAKVSYPSAAFCKPEAIQCNDASISIESVSHAQDLSSKLDVESSGSAFMVLSSLEESEEIVSL